MNEGIHLDLDTWIDTNQHSIVLCHSMFLPAGAWGIPYVTNIMLLLNQYHRIALFCARQEWGSGLQGKGTSIGRGVGTGISIWCGYWELVIGIINININRNQLLLLLLLYCKCLFFLVFLCVRCWGPRFWVLRVRRRLEACSSEWVAFYYYYFCMTQETVRRLPFRCYTRKGSDLDQSQQRKR